MALSKAAQVEAVLFASPEPMEKKRLSTMLGCSMEELSAAVAELHKHYYARGIAVIESEDELELRTSPDTSELIKKLREAELSRDLGKAGLEALAVILYRGGATRTEIDWIRGVNSSQTVRSLLLRGLIERDEDPKDKRRFVYKGTTDALAHLGISRADELPRYRELSKEADAVIEKSEHADA